MNKRVMTVDELYNFCLQNNFSKFNSDESGSELVVEMPGRFAKDTKDESRFTEGMTPFVSRAFHDKVNLNKSKIETEVFKDNLPSSHLRPILANIVKDEETGLLDFGSHDFHIEKIIEKDKDGNSVEVEKTVYDEQPIGVIDGSRNAIEYDKDTDVNRAVLYGYLYNEYCQDAIDILNRRGTVDCSVELSIRSMSFDGSEKVLILDDFYVSALTLLSAKTLPGMAGSNFKIEDFEAKDNIKFDKEEKLIELLENLNKTLSNFNKEQNSVQTQSEEGGTDNKMIKFEELLAKYGKTVDDITFDYEEMSDEDLEAKFAEMFDDDNTDGDNSDNGESGEPSNDGECEGDEGTSDPESTEDENQSFEKIIRTYEISHEDTKYALYQLLSEYEDADNEWYFINAVYDDHFTYENWNGDKIFGQNYTKDGDNVAFNGERYNLHRELLTDSEFAELQSMRSNYASLKEFKENAEKNELHAKKEEIINSEKYSVIAGKDVDGKYTNEEFAKLVESMDDYSVEEFETKVKIMHSDFMAEHSDFSLIKDTSKQTSKKTFNIPSKKESKKSRYGGLFSKKDN